MFGIVEIITLLLGMTGFGLTANPSAPTADQSLAYALADPDVAAHLDAASLVPGNWKLLNQLADLPQIKASPELKKAVTDAVAKVNLARGAAQQATGIDVTADLADATAFVQIVPSAKPRFVLAVHGRFTTRNLDKIATLSGHPVARSGTGSIIDAGEHEPAMALTRDGVLLVGTAGLLRDRLADGWAAPSHARGTNLGYLADVINARPVFAVVLTMSPAARSAALAGLPGPGFTSDVVTRHKVAAFSVFRDGLGWTWVDSNPAGLDAMELVARGTLEVLRAAQIAPRGLARIVMGAIESYRGVDPRVDDLIKHKAELLRLVESYTGDGNFKVAVDKNPRALQLTVRATGKTLSEVLPFGLMVPAAVVGWLSFGEARAAPVMLEATSPPADDAGPGNAGRPARPPSAKPAPRPPAKRP